MQRVSSNEKTGFHSTVSMKELPRFRFGPLLAHFGGPGPILGIKAWFLVYFWEFRARIWAVFGPIWASGARILAVFGSLWLSGLDFDPFGSNLTHFGGQGIDFGPDLALGPFFWSVLGGFRPRSQRDRDPVIISQSFSSEEVRDQITI